MIRDRSLFARVGAEARLKAQRALLRRTLRACRWDIAATGAALGMGTNSSPVWRVIRECEMEAEVRAALEARGRNA